MQVSALDGGFVIISIDYCYPSYIKGQAKIIKKSVILFCFLNMTICCKHVHRLELQKFFYFFLSRIHQLD